MNIYETTFSKIKNKTANIGIIGAGYVGLPNLLSYTAKGYNSTAFDIDERKVELINNGESYIEDAPAEKIKQYREENILHATTDFSKLKDMDVIVIDVQTPVDENRVPNLEYVASASKAVIENSRAGQLIILESTTYPTTTFEYLVKPLQEKFEVGKDIFVAYSPERIDPSNTEYKIEDICKVIGGHTMKCAELAQALIGENTHLVENTTIAEMSKLYENTFRFVNIALANELAKICDKLEVNPFEVIEASATKPFGFMPFYPTTSIGGHCIPVDPYYLSWFSKKHDIETDLINTAGAVNDSMVDFITKSIMQKLNDKDKTLKNNKVALIGASYKPNISDVRNAPVTALVPKLESYKANVDILDDLVSEIKINGETRAVKSVDYKNLENYDLVVILMNHSYLDLDAIRSNSSTVFDTKNCMKEYNDHFFSL